MIGKARMIGEATMNRLTRMIGQARMMGQAISILEARMIVH